MYKKERPDHFSLQLTRFFSSGMDQDYLATGLPGSAMPLNGFFIADGALVLVVDALTAVAELVLCALPLAVVVVVPVVVVVLAVELGTNDANPY